MDPEKVVMIVIVTVALGVGGFILWGPPDRCKRKAGRIGGLVNLGFTCFLNTLLQALAACPFMLEWLSQHDQKPGSLVQALRDVLLVLNGQHSTIFDDPFTPSAVIRSLVLKGWVISPGEQDAHELFHVIMTTLLEETHVERTQVPSLSVALEEYSNKACDVRILPRRIHSDSGNSLPRQLTRSSTGTPIVSSCHSFHIVSQAPPFQGFLTSQIQCMVCNYKSAVMYDKFDSLSLHLPGVGENILMRKLTLYQLLNKFVSTEIVKDVTCEKCIGCPDGKNVKKVSAMKTLNFGKLPKCLCIHIQRTIWQKNGQAYKRYDYVEFPEYLSMDEYTFIQVQKQKVVPESFHDTGDIEKFNIRNNFSIKHLYKLSSVIVHTGSLDSGHFITYRRAPVRENSWYYTSDTEVRESSLKEVMQACAYMLFYNKCVGVSKS